MTRRITAIILTVAIVFTACSATFASASEKKITEPKNLSEYAEMLEQNGYPAMTTEQFMSMVKTANTAFRFLIGKGSEPQPHFNFVVDDMVKEICDYIEKETQLDILMIVTRMPESNQLAEFVVETFDINTAALREEIFKLKDEMDSQGRSFEAVLLHFFAVYFSVIEECKAYCEPRENENEYEIHLAITMKDGTVEKVGTGVVINTETEQVYSADGNGILGTGYSFSIPETLLYAQVNAWTRNFGFCLFYDIFSYVTPFFFYDTRRIKFDYDGFEWMIQIWKGNYLVSNGAEVGIYSREEAEFGTYYDCATDEQMMEMSMELYHGDDLIFSRPKQLHWWLTGFRISDRLYPANKMTLRFSIDMKDEEMLNAFCKAIDSHYRRDMSYTVDGLTVNVIW